MLPHLNNLGRDRRRIGSQCVENQCTESPTHAQALIGHLPQSLNLHLRPIHS